MGSGSNVVLNERLARITRPAKSVPFRVSSEEAEDCYRARLKESRFTPGNMLTQQTLDHFRPIYIPCWHYTFEAEGDSECIGGGGSGGGGGGGGGSGF